MMNNSIRKTALLAAVALPAALVAQAASAALITQWNYEIDSAFTDFTETGGDGSVTGSDNNTDAFAGSPTKLSWGEPFEDGGDQSSIAIESDVDSPPVLETGDMIGVPGATFTHDNNVITSSSSMLDTFELSTQIFLEAIPASAGDETVGPIEFDGFFNETVNVAPCVDGSVSECDDIFVLSNAATISAIGAGQSFIIDDHQYTVFLDLSDDIGELTDDQCAAADSPEGCVGFLTEEDTLNEFFSTVRITATEIPAPGVLALLGIGLLGLGFTHRGRRS